MTVASTEAALQRAAATIRDLRSRLVRLEQAGAHGDDSLAVVGMACRLPGGVTTPDAYWDLLLQARRAVQRVDDWRWAGRPPRVGGGEHAGTLSDVGGFDAAFFGIAAAEAQVMDPQQRLTLEVSWEAVERWGRRPADLAGSDTGVFVGVSHQDYLLALLASGVPVTGPVGPGNARSVVANRVSYQLGLRGPSMVVDTACSSSLVAVHLAAQSLRTGECSTALVGGANLVLAPESTLVTGRALPLAPDGRCKTFDADADGMVRGEGVVVVVLRRLADALADGDHVHAVIRATGTNQDGRTNGLTAPSPLAQQQLLAAVLARSGLSAHDVTYVETHGTGTPLGDPIEFEALAAAYGSAAPEAATCWLGSVKPNLGHLESAAGLASLLKAVLAVERGAIPAQPGLGRINPEIPLEGSRFDVPRETVRWETTNRRAAVSSFGFGGTNAHVVLEQAPPPDADAPPSAPAASDAMLLPLSASAPSALGEMGARYAELIRGGTATIAEVARCAARRRTHHAYRRAVVVDPGADVAEVARAVAASATSCTRAAAGGTAFVFGGQGSTWSAEVLHDPDVVAEARAWDAECAAVGLPAVSAVLQRVADQPASAADTRVGQLAIAVLETAMARRLEACGVVPDVVVGHSLGEVVAAVVAGMISRADAARLIRGRSRLQHQHGRGGAMASLRATRGQVEHLLRSHGDGRISVAAHNAARAVVVAGPRDAVTALVAAADVDARLLSTDYAFHSPALAGVAAPMRDVAAAVGARPGRLALISTVTGRPAGRGPVPPQRWVDNVTEPVLFRQAILAALQAGITRFVEVSPHATLLSHVEHTAAEQDLRVTAVAAGDRHKPLRATLLAAAARAWEAGTELDWEVLYPGPVPVLPSLPTSRLDPTHHWYQDPAVTPPPHAQTTVTSDPPYGAHDSSSLQQWLRALVAEVAGFTSIAEVDLHRPATELDVDSAAFVEVKNRLEDHLQVAVPITLLLDGASLADVAEALTRHGGADRDGTSPTSDDPLARLLGGRRVEDLTEDEIDGLLAAHGGSDSA